MTSYDVIVVGARCAGSPFGMLLARKGYRVLVVEKATFPRDTISSHWLWQGAVARLERWGLLDAVRASGCPPLDGFTVSAGGVEVRSGFLPCDGISEGYSVRRTVLDTILAEAAVEAGAEVRQGFTVSDLVWEDGRVVGIRGGTGGAPETVERARLVVGADGLRSLVARRVEAETYHERAAQTCSYYAYWSGLPEVSGFAWAGDGVGGAAAPTNDDLTLVAFSWPIERSDEVRADIPGAFARATRECPYLRDRIREGRRETPFNGMRRIPNFFRRSHGPGWALVGDAGYHKDPITAQGITDAFRDAEALAEAVSTGFEGTLPLEVALSAYERDRDELVLPFYEHTLGIAAMTPVADRARELLAAIADDPEQASRFVGIWAELVKPEEFFSAENIERLFGSQRATV